MQPGRSSPSAPAVLLVAGAPPGSPVPALVARMVLEDGGAGACVERGDLPRARCDVAILTVTADTFEGAPLLAAAAAAVLSAKAGAASERDFGLGRWLSPDARLVLDADDAVVLARGRASARPRFWYSLDAGHEEVARHGDAGGETAFVEDGTLFFLRRELHEALITQTRISPAVGSTSRRRTSNALAAAALATCAGVSNDAIAAALEHFDGAPPSATPG